MEFRGVSWEKMVIDDEELECRKVGVVLMVVKLSWGLTVTPTGRFAYDVISHVHSFPAGALIYSTSPSHSRKP